MRNYNTTSNKYIAPCGTDGRLFTTDVSAKFKFTWHRTRTNIKNPTRSNLDIMPQFKNQWSVASSHCKWWRRQLLKMEGFPTFKSSWPWPWIGSYCILSCITHRHLPRTYMPNFTEIEETLCGWTDGRTFETHFIRSTQKSRPNETAYMND